MRRITCITGENPLNRGLGSKGLGSHTALLLLLKEERKYCLLPSGSGLCTSALTIVKQIAMIFLQLWMSLIGEVKEVIFSTCHAQNRQRKPNERLLLTVIENFILAQEKKILSAKVFLSVPRLQTPSEEITKNWVLHHREPRSTRNCINQWHKLHSEADQVDTCGYSPQKGHNEEHLLELKLFVYFVPFWFISFSLL